MVGMLREADVLLHARGRDAVPPKVGTLLGLIVVFGVTYGAAMGTYSGGLGVRGWQMVYSGVKVPLLLLATFGLGLPSYFVVNSLMGLREDFGLAVRALLAT